MSVSDKLQREAMKTGAEQLTNTPCGTCLPTQSAGLVTDVTSHHHTQRGQEQGQKTHKLQGRHFLPFPQPTAPLPTLQCGTLRREGSPCSGKQRSVHPERTWVAGLLTLPSAGKREKLVGRRPGPLSGWLVIRRWCRDSQGFFFFLFFFPPTPR